MPLSKREQRVARQFASLEKLQEKAKALYDRADQRVRKFVRTHKLDKKPVKITEAGKHLWAEDQYKNAIAADESGGDSKLWGHGAVRRWKLVTKNLD